MQIIHRICKPVMPHIDLQIGKLVPEILFFIKPSVNDCRSKPMAETVYSDARRSPFFIQFFIGVPFGQHPLGYMVIRNPVKNIGQHEPLQLACFVAMMMVNQKRRQDAERRYLIDDFPDDGKLRIRYNILGQHSLEINGRKIHEQDLTHPNRRGWVILLYLVLHRKAVDQLGMAADILPD